MKQFDIPQFLEFLPEPLLERLQQAGEQIPAVSGLTVAAGLREKFPRLESDDCLAFVCDVYRSTRRHLNQILEQRAKDRLFIDSQTKQLAESNTSRAIDSAEFESVIGRRDADGRIVVGPLRGREDPFSVIEIPDFLRGSQVTLFGPPDTAKMSINAMNAWHRRSADEPAIVTELVDASGQVPRWGADNEDSKTPIMSDFLQACENLIGCFDRTIQFKDLETGRNYQLEQDRLAIPIKRIPGLALPDGNHLLLGNPLPLHLYDFVSHVFHNWQSPESLVFYVPKLENEEEAGYLADLIVETERRIHDLHPLYALGTVKLFIVFENPRAIFRIREMAAALTPWFIGGSLGWHDFLASTARLFREAPQYRIPVKADPNIVINHIRESHRILVEALQPIGALAIGGMYGVLSEDGNRQSYDVSIVGYIKDVVTQLRRGLDGFWVAHPGFVRIGLALVEAVKRKTNDPGDQSLEEFITALIADPVERGLLIGFVNAPDVSGIAADDPRYERAVLAATLGESSVIANNDPAEIRYNVFQALQYLADWLSGNGCVALPATIKTSTGQDVFVRIMDDLATTERSRWEIWAEIRHQRVSIEDFEKILQEEMVFIRRGIATASKRIQVLYTGEAKRWYPIAEKLLRQLVTDRNPVEFASQLLLPFTFDLIRQSEHPWQAVVDLCPGKYQQ